MVADLICAACGQPKTVTASTSQATLIAEIIQLRQQAMTLEAEVKDKLERIDALVKVRDVLTLENGRLRALWDWRPERPKEERKESDEAGPPDA